MHFDLQIYRPTGTKWGTWPSVTLMLNKHDKVFLSLSPPAEVMTVSVYS